MRSRTAVFPTNPTPTLVPTPAVTPEPLTCPNVASIVRFGVHRRPSRIVVTFRGAVDPVQAQNPGNYALVGPGRDGVFGTADDEHIGIVSAVFDPSAESVTLAPSRRLNVRDHLLFSIKAGVFRVPERLRFRHPIRRRSGPRRLPGRSPTTRLHGATRPRGGDIECRMTDDRS